MDPRIAFQGEVELINASWSLDAGRTVDLRLTGNAYERVHPFKRFQQRRNGRMGTRFSFSCADTETGLIFIAASEVMLAGWKDSSYGGQQITLWLDDEADRHPFAGYARRKNGAPGHLFAIALVELSDDEQPINQAQRDRVEGAEGSARDPERGTDPRAPQGATQQRPLGAQDDVGQRQAAGRAPPASGHRPKRKLSAQAHLMVTGAMFVRWLEETNPLPHGHRWDATKARHWAKREIEVESLSELDQSQRARDLFERKVRKPFAKWNNQEPD